MGRLPRVVRWATESEWEEVHALLMASDTASLKQGLLRVAGWRARGSLPLAVETTYATVHAVCQDADQTLDPLSLRQLYAMVVIRFVNGFCDAEQKGKNARSVQTIAAELGIPTFVVDLRHDATHTALPSLPSLRVAVPRILGWLKAHYWERQDEQLTDAREAVAAQVQSYALKVAADAKHAKTDAILKQVTHACSPNTLHTTLLPALLKQGALVPSVSPPTITTQVQKRQIKLWGRALRRFASTWPHFVPLLLSSLLHKMAYVAAGEAEDCEAAEMGTWKGAEETVAAAANGDPSSGGSKQPLTKKRRKGSSGSGEGAGGSAAAVVAAAYAVRMGSNAQHDTLAWLGHWCRWLLKTFPLDVATKRSLLRECTAIPCKAAEDTMSALRASLRDAAASAALGKLAKLAAACPAVLKTPTRTNHLGTGSQSSADDGADADSNSDADADSDDDDDGGGSGSSSSSTAAGKGKGKLSEAAAFQQQVQSALFAAGAAASRGDPAGTSLQTPWGLASEWQWSGVPIGAAAGGGGSRISSATAFGGGSSGTCLTFADREGTARGKRNATVAFNSSSNGRHHHQDDSSAESDGDAAGSKQPAAVGSSAVEEAGGAGGAGARQVTGWEGAVGSIKSKVMLF